MTVPTTYDSNAIVVTPLDLTGARTKIVGDDPHTLGGWIGQILESMKRIEEAMADLKLGWAGETANEAEAFTTQLQLGMQQLFGGAGDAAAADGSLSRVGMAIGLAGDNYNHAEEGISQMLHQLIQGMQPTNGGPTDDTAYIPPPDTETSMPWQGAVSEIF